MWLHRQNIIIIYKLLMRERMGKRNPRKRYIYLFYVTFLKLTNGKCSSPIKLNNNHRPFKIQTPAFTTFGTTPSFPYHFYIIMVSIQRFYNFLITPILIMETRFLSFPSKSRRQWKIITENSFTATVTKLTFLPLSQ